MRFDVWGVAAATMLVLTACGGSGGGGEENQEFSVALQVDGVADASNPMTAGEATMVNVPSGATLAFNSGIETNWVQTATRSTYEIKDASSTAKSLTVSSNEGGTISIVFTDKKDPQRKTTLNVIVAPREFARIPVVEGEVRNTTAHVSVRGSGSYDFETRIQVALDGTDGAYREEFTDTGLGETTPYFYMRRDAEDRMLGSENVSGLKCSYSVPLAHVAYPMHVGKTWSGESSRTCDGVLTFNVAFESTIEAFEPVTVEAGTFDALRIKSELAYTNSNHSGIPGGAYALTRTCWVAVDIGREIKCEYAYVYPDGTANGVTDAVTEVMTSYTR